MTLAIVTVVVYMTIQIKEKTECDCLTFTRWQCGAFLMFFLYYVYSELVYTVGPIIKGYSDERKLG